jgi:hypothetical protein
MSIMSSVVEVTEANHVYLLSLPVIRIRVDDLLGSCSSHDPDQVDRHWLDLRSIPSHTPPSFFKLCNNIRAARPTLYLTPMVMNDVQPTRSVSDISERGIQLTINDDFVIITLLYHLSLIQVSYRIQ